MRTFSEEVDFVLSRKGVVLTVVILSLMVGLLIEEMTSQTVKNEVRATVSTESFGRSFKQATTLEIVNIGGTVVLIDLKTGNVEIGKGLDMNEASRLFWKVVLPEAFPQPCVGNVVSRTP